MLEENKFLPVDSIELYGDSIGRCTLYDASHANESEEQRIWTVTTTASLAYGNESAKNPEALYERMKSIKHESLWEMCRSGQAPYTIENSMRSQMTDMMYHTDTNQHKQNIACFRIKVPIFVARQFMRHRSFSYLEMSRRYTKGSKVPFEFWFPPYMNGSKIAFNADQLYDELIHAGYETQVASRFLPQITYTEFYCMCEEKGLKNFLNLRLDSHAQKEIQDLSFSMLQLLYTHQYELYKKVVPNDEIDSRLRNKEK
jgi:thymidylate synthase (FAD)